MAQLKRYRSRSEGITPYPAYLDGVVYVFGQRPSLGTMRSAVKLMSIADTLKTLDRDDPGQLAQVVQVMDTLDQVFRSTILPVADAQAALVRSDYEPNGDGPTQVGGIDQLVEALDVEAGMELLGDVLDAVMARPTTESPDSSGGSTATTSTTGGTAPDSTPAAITG